MNYKNGDTIVHWTYGLGKIIRIEEKQLGEIKQPYYVVEINRLMIWVPVDEGNQGSIRFPLESQHFKALFDILRMQGEGLPDPYDKRKMKLQERMKKWTLPGLCHLIRDLSDLSQSHRLNPFDANVLSWAEERLLDEWVFSLGTERSKAIDEMNIFLRENEFERG